MPLLCPQTNWQSSNANRDCAQFPNTWKPTPPNYCRACEIFWKTAYTFLAFQKISWHQRVYSGNEKLSIQKYQIEEMWLGLLLNLFFFSLFSQSYLFPFFICLFYYIAQFLVLAIWIKIPINISWEFFNYLGALGRGAWQAPWSSVKAEALCACNRRWRGYLSV